MHTTLKTTPEFYINDDRNNNDALNKKNVCHRRMYATKLVMITDHLHCYSHHKISLATQQTQMYVKSIYGARKKQQQ